MSDRRKFLKAGVGAMTLFPEVMRGSIWQQPVMAQTDVAGLPGWEPGVMEIHHIDTGRGNSTLVVGPDGTTLLIDAGEAHSAVRTMSPARPDASRRAGEWIARYVSRQLVRVRREELDVMLLTHLHGDHVGEVTASAPVSAKGSYRLTGAADVADAVRVREMIDRGWPEYAYPAITKDPSALNYIALAKSMAARGTKVQRAHAGSVEQLALRHERAQHGDFRARVLAVNGEVWTGNGEDAGALFPPVAGMAEKILPTENMCCVAAVLEYGRFRYFAGGDLTCDTDYGAHLWRDIETPVARVAGPASVAVVNHHGYFDAGGPEAVRSLRPKVWVLPSWHVSHPAMNVIANLFSDELYAGERRVFATGMTPEALLTTERFSSKLSSSDGHVVVRVPAGGHEFSVYVVNARDEQGMVTARFGPFAT